MSLLAAATAAPAAPMDNLIPLQVDALRADRVGLRREGHFVAPHLTPLSSACVSFQHAVANAPLDAAIDDDGVHLPLPHRHRMTNRYAVFDLDRREPSIPTPKIIALAEILKDAGVHATGAHPRALIHHAILQVDCAGVTPAIW